ncbi:MAG: AAA family ATPase, partial [Clostridia bacterium]|nr:AAA family ATPase [Clostridia bacterium]
MGYKVLYRKYRPDNFENVVGQDYVVKMLRNAIESGKHSHAYIFTGPRGTGKTSSAKVFAKAINCENPFNGSPCNKCNSCLSFKESPDIIEIDAASNNGVDEIRELINNVKLVPSSLRYKVYIIDEV